MEPVNKSLIRRLWTDALKYEVPYIGVTASMQPFFIGDEAPLSRARSC